MMVMMMALAFRIIAFVIIFDFRKDPGHLLLQCVRLFHGLQDLHAVQLRHGRRDHGRVLVMLPDQLHAVLNLPGAGNIRPAQDNCGRMLDLIDEEFTKVLHIYLRLARIHDRNQRTNLAVRPADRACRAYHVAQFSHAAGFDQDPVRMIGLQYLLQRLAEITHQTAADASAVHFCYLYAGFFHEAAVDSDFTEFVFNQDDLLPCIGVLQQFLDQRCLACSQKPGKHINLCHRSFFSSSAVFQAVRQDLHHGSPFADRYCTLLLREGQACFLTFPDFHFSRSPGIYPFDFLFRSFSRIVEI